MMDYKAIPLKGTEYLYTYRNSQQISGQTGLVGTSYGTKFKGKFYWISEQPDGKWCIEIKGLTGEIYPLKEGLMSLTSAKRYFSRYIKS